MNFIFFLGFGIKKQMFMKKDIFKYLSKFGDVLVPELDYSVSLEENLNNIKFTHKKYVVIGHSLGAYFVYKINKLIPNKISFSIILDGSLILKEYHKILEEEFTREKKYNLWRKNPLKRYSEEFYQLKKIKKNFYNIRNIETKPDSSMLREAPYWTECCLKEAYKMEKINPKTYYNFFLFNEGHNFFITKKGFPQVKKILDLIFKELSRC